MNNRKHWIKLYWFCNWIPLFTWFLFFGVFLCRSIESFIFRLSVNWLASLSLSVFLIKSRALKFHYYILSKQLKVPCKDSAKLGANNSVISDLKYVVSWPSLQGDMKYWIQGEVVILFLILFAASVSSTGVLMCWCFETFSWFLIVYLLD